MDAGRATGVTATVTPRGGGKVISPPNMGKARLSRYFNEILKIAFEL